MVYALPFIEKQCRRSKPVLDGEARTSSYHIGMLVFGCIAACVGLYDLWFLSDPGVVRNRLMESPVSSISIGILMIAVGSSSIYASNETKSSTELKLISIVWLWMLSFAVWDRARPPLLTLWMIYGFNVVSSITMFIFPDFGNYFQLTLIISFIILCAFIELGSMGFGPVDSEQYLTGFLAMFLGVVGAYTQVVPFESTSKYSQIGFVSVLSAWAVLHGYLQGSLLSAIVCIGILAALSQFPAYFSTLSTWSTTIALSLWWYMLRVRSGNPEVHYFSRYEIFAIIFLAIFKFNLRRLITLNAYENVAVGIWVENISLFIEKFSFFVWGAFILFVYPSVEMNWFFDTILCWTEPAIPNYSLVLFYLANTASAVEDVFWWLGSGSSSPRYFIPRSLQWYRNGRDRESFDNKLLGLYHLLLMGLLTGSYATNHLKIGSILMFLFHASDVLHYLWRMSCALPSPVLQCSLLTCNIAVWCYCRIWLLFTVVMYSVAMESRSFRFGATCEPGACNWMQSVERIPFLAALVNLLFINIIWTVIMSVKWYDLITCQRVLRDALPSKGSSPLKRQTNVGISSSTSFGSSLSNLVRHSRQSPLDNSMV
ncbi:hypothetical protein EON65_15335 [archaeon]|nr:MAG: hypothetical protein EON65_15335 [archaeon]